MSSVISSASSCSIKADQSLESNNPSAIHRITSKVYAAAPAWLKNITFGTTYLVALPFTQGLMFALGLYIGKTMFVRPLMTRFRLSQV